MRAARHVWQERSEIRFLSCGPDFERELTGDMFNDPFNDIILVAKNGASASVSGLTIADTGTGMMNEKLFAMPLGAFKFEAIFELKIEIDGQFNFLDDSTMIFGIGNGKNFIGVIKSSRIDTTMGTVIQGTYQDAVLMTIDKREPLANWNQISQTANQQQATLRISTYQIGNQRQRGMRLQFSHGPKDTSDPVLYTDYVLIPESEQSIGLEVIAFREKKDQKYTIDRLKVSGTVHRPRTVRQIIITITNDDNDDERLVNWHVNVARSECVLTCKVRQNMPGRVDACVFAYMCTYTGHTERLRHGNVQHWQHGTVSWVISSS